MEERRGRGGEPRGPQIEGLSVGMAVKLRDGVGSWVCWGRGEHGGLGDGDGEYGGNGEEYMELGDDSMEIVGGSRPDWLARFAEDEPLESFSNGGLDGKVASRGGWNTNLAEPGLVGMGMLSQLLLGVFIMLTSAWLRPVFNVLNASLLRIAGSIVLKGSSGMAVSLIGRL